jgi:hypothetical protein
VTWNDPGLIKKAYDVGAVGVMNVGSALNLGLLASARHFAELREEFDRPS